MNSILKLHPLLSVATLRCDPVVILVNDFDEKSAAAFRTEMSKAQNTGQPIIPVVIDSYGGECHSLIAMADAIRASAVPVATIVEGKAMSCGALLFAFGAPGYRFCGPSARILIHEVSSGSWGKVDDVRVKADETVFLNKWAFDSLDQNCGKSPGWFQDQMHQRNHADWTMGADEAIQIGLANHKRIPSFETTVHVKFELK